MWATSRDEPHRKLPPPISAHVEAIWTEIGGLGVSPEWVRIALLFGMPSLRMHMVMPGGFTAAAMLVLVLIIAFDWPFRGEVQVAPSMFKHVQQNMAALDKRAL
jgi:hypothetical protein